MGLLGFPLGPTEQTLRMISAGSQSYEGFVAVSGGAGFYWRGAEGWRCGACGETPLPGVGMNGHDKVIGYHGMSSSTSGASIHYKFVQILSSSI